MKTETTIEKVQESEKYFTIHYDGLAFGVDKDDWPEQVPPPKAGDTIVVHPDASPGAAVTGIDVNGRRVFRKTDEELDAQRRASIDGYAARKREEAYEALRDRRRRIDRGEKLKEVDTIVIGGISPGYEHACQEMLRAGLQWLEDYSEAASEVARTVKVADMPAGIRASIEKAVVAACPGGPSGAQVGAVVCHLVMIARDGREQWLANHAANDPQRAFVWDGTVASCVKPSDKNNAGGGNPLGLATIMAECKQVFEQLGDKVSAELFARVQLHLELAHAMNGTLDATESAVIKAARELVRLKAIRSAEGKTPEYLAGKDKAWSSLVNALALHDGMKSNGHMMPMKSKAVGDLLKQLVKDPTLTLQDKVLLSEMAQVWKMARMARD